MTYKGIVRGRVIELADEVGLPEGTEVEVMVQAHPGEKLAPSGHPRGSSQAILAAWGKPAHCTPEDVDALRIAIFSESTSSGTEDGTR
jgi:hypothetical protein